MNYTSFAKDIMLTFLQDAFSQPDFYEDPNFVVGSLEDLDNFREFQDPNDADTENKLINNFLWSENQEDTQIFIADSWTENMERTEPRPALIVTRGDVRWMNSSIDQFQQQSFATGARTYMDLIAGDITINCFSRNGLQSELLSTIVFSAVQFFAKDIRERTRLFEVNTVTIGRESLVQSDSKEDLFVVPVGIGLYWHDRWRSIKLNPDVIKKIDFDLKAKSVKQSGSVCPVRTLD